jgi:hypothetical protein
LGIEASSGGYILMTAKAGRELTNAQAEQLAPRDLVGDRAQREMGLLAILIVSGSSCPMLLRQLQRTSVSQEAEPVASSGDNTIE